MASDAVIAADPAAAAVVDVPRDTGTLGVQAKVQRVLHVHFPRCDGADIHQGDARTPGRCGCEGKQHSYLLPELGALLYTFYPEAYEELCVSIGNPSYEKLGRCVQDIEGVPLTLGLRAINGKRVRNAILGVRRRLSDARRPTVRPDTRGVCGVLRSDLEDARLR